MVTLTAIKALIEDFAISKVLVVAPLRVAATVWQEETQKWDHLTGLRCSKVLGSRQEREAALRQEADIYIINRENIPWLVEHQAGISKVWPFDMLVLDELSSFKSPKAERFKAMKRVLPAVRRVVGLTGTPAPNGLIDLWSQIYLLDQGKRLGKFVTRYREEYFRPGHQNGAIVYSWVPLDRAPEQIYGKIADICMSMKAEDYLTMPDRIDLTQTVVLPDAARTKYDRMEHDLVMELCGETITAQNAAVLTGKLLQIASGAIYAEDGSYAILHDARLDALEDLIEASNGEPVLVYYAYRHERDRIMRRFPEARELRTPKDVDDWNHGKIRILIAHPASAGHGLNLQYGGHIMIWYGLTWSLELYQQACARLYRQGQDKPVRIYHLVTEKTIDEDVIKVLTGKADRQDALINAVKARLEKYES